MPRCSLHLRFSDCSAVSRPSAPATAVPPSVLRSFELQQAQGGNEESAEWLLTLDEAARVQHTLGRRNVCKSPSLG